MANAPGGCSSGDLRLDCLHHLLRADAEGALLHGGWGYLPEVRAGLFPVTQECGCQGAARALLMLLNKASQLSLRGGGLHPEDVLLVVNVHPQARVIRVVDVQDTTAHAGPDVAADEAQGHDDAAGHVLAQVVARALDDGVATGVPHTEALTNPAAEVHLSTRGSVEAGVACNYVVLGIKGGVDGRVCHNGAAMHALAHVIVALPDHLQVDALDVPDAEGLPGRSTEGELQLASKSLVAIPPCDGSSNASTHRTVRVRNGQLDLRNTSIALHDMQHVGLGQEIVIERATVGVCRGLPRSTRPSGANLLIRWGAGEEPAQVHAVRLRQLLGPAGIATARAADLCRRWRRWQVGPDRRVAPGPE
mmetsp:Transcript_32770/g.97559  ORF Transcript_32770/g.97559 Transcript_32770/m.97559 type:complete len:362 (-) Transcript_32770:209-1294(-)